MSKKFTRRAKNRPAPVTYCVVVEGIKTEKLYFLDFKQVFDYRQMESRQNAKKRGNLELVDCSLVVVPAGGRSFEHVVEVAEKQATVGHQKVWCVVDADFYVRLTGRQKIRADEAYNRALSKGVSFIFSRPCFEVWYRHHFNSQSSAWVDGATAKRNISSLWPEYSSMPTRHWELLRPKISAAIKNAKAVKMHHGCPPKLMLDCDASTDVDKLMEELLEIDHNCSTVEE